MRIAACSRAWPLSSSPYYYNLPELAQLCREIDSIRQQRSKWLANLQLSRDPLPEYDCRVPEVAVRMLAPTRAAAQKWDVWELPSGELLIADGPDADRRYAHVQRDGAMTWFDPPSGLEHHPFAPFHVTANQPFLLSFDPQDKRKLMLGTWLGSSSDPEQFEQRPLAGGNPSIVLTSAGRWVFVDDEVACQGERAFALVHDPSVGLQRYVCSDQDCGDPAILTTLDSSSSLRSTAGGVRVVLLTGKSDVDLHVVDEPLGGPLERIERLVRDDQLESGWLDGADLPFMTDGQLHATSERAQELRIESPRAAVNE